MAALLVALAGGLLGCLPVVDGLRLEAAPPCSQERAHDMLQNDRTIREEDWIKAAKEEGMDPSRVSLFGRLAPKLARSTLTAWKANYTPGLKTIRYSFVGSYAVPRKTHMSSSIVADHRKRREWVIDFAKKHFTTRDYLNIIDVPTSWTPLGRFDYSAHVEEQSFHDHAVAFHRSALEEDSDQQVEWWDRSEYLRVLHKSQFALCPGGDLPWSMRVFEVILAGAIPVIQSEEQDWRPNASRQLKREVLQGILDRVHYVRVADLPRAVYNPVMAMQNLRLAIKYLTFMEGDNALPGMMACIAPGGKETLVLADPQR